VFDILNYMKKAVKKGKMTIDKLAIMVAKGFENTATKEDLKNLEARMEAKMATKTDMEGIKNQIEGVNNRIDEMSLNRVKYEDHNKLKVRVDFLEKKLEIKK